jgi:hypothetical protein
MIVNGAILKLIGIPYMRYFTPHSVAAKAGSYLLGFQNIPLKAIPAEATKLTASVIALKGMLAFLKTLTKEAMKPKVLSAEKKVTLVLSSLQQRLPPKQPSL